MNSNPKKFIQSKLLEFVLKVNSKVCVLNGMDEDAEELDTSNLKAEELQIPLRSTVM